MSRGRYVEQAVWPKSFESRVRGWIVEPDQIAPEELARLADVPPAGSPLYDLPKMVSYVYALRWNLARARSVEDISLGLAKAARPDVVLSYFQCPDSLPHRFWIFQKGLAAIERRLSQFGIDTSHAAELERRFGKVIERCYQDVDRRMGHLIDELAGPDTLVLVVSDHGFGDGPVPHPFKSEPYGGIHWSTGVMLARTPGLDPRSEIRGASVLDITPSILYFLGLAVAEDMRGKVIEALFQGGPKQKIEPVSTYEKKPQTECPYAEGFPPKPESFIW
ncbi:MAG: alkaline phosphatase family protein [Deltaproteobacteria bacterium]|nr:alkaline phosphatase family protein [Deltaproteobacteria bacterium]